MGFLDGMFMAPLFGAPDDKKLLNTIGKCAVGMNDVQLAAIVDKYVRSHPEHWHLDVKLEAFDALREA
jgi:hypothetical protein